MVEKLEYSHIVDKNVKGAATLENSAAVTQTQNYYMA